MKPLLISLIVIALFGCENESKTPSFAEHEITTENILFIGNSYTYRNGGIDKHLNYLLTGTEHHDEEVLRRAAKGRYHLYTHWEDPETKALFKSKKWDKVILQEYSSGPLREKEDFHKYAKRWVNEIRKVNENAEIFLYSTWNYKDSPLMDDSLNTAYTLLSKEIGATVVHVGMLWKQLRSKIDLYDGDRAHPNRKGTFVTACLFYEYLFGKDVSKTKNTDPFLPLSEQTELKMLVHEFNTYSKEWSHNKKDRS